MEIFLTFVKVFVVGGLFCVVGGAAAGQDHADHRPYPGDLCGGRGGADGGRYLSNPWWNSPRRALRLPSPDLATPWPRVWNWWWDSTASWGALSGGTVATAAGIAAAIFFGYLNALIFNPKTKK